MEDEILVTVRLPAGQFAYDVLIPCREPLHVILAMLKQAFGELSNGAFTPDEDTALYEEGSGAVLDTDGTPTELGLKNGSMLILI